MTLIYHWNQHKKKKYYTKLVDTGAAVVVIAWWLELQLPVQSVPITTKVVSSNPVQWEGEHDTTLYDNVSH